MKSFRMKNHEVIEKWRSLIGGEYEVTGVLEGYFNTTETFRAYNDGKIYYYSLLLGEIIDGVHVVYDHTKPGGSFHSKTTSDHVNRLKKVALKVIDYN